MRIANRKKFTFSCIFFTLFMLLFDRTVINVNKGQLSQVQPVVMAVDKGETKKSAATNINKNISKDVIVLDAGHGGIDNGTSYKNLYEKDLTLKMVKYAEAYLKSKGYTVVLTRNKDELIPLKEIGRRVNASSGTVFVSIHVNSISDANFKGITTLYYDVQDYQKDERIKLANILEKEAVKSDKWESKGIKKQNVAILRYSKIPCALVECGFITNSEDRDKLSKDEVLKRLSENISNGIIKYLKQSSDS
ncbi:N-acetylmuramoyl-L-alanine amidase family protein [Clostridium drakei]|uniref:N-acetylmuramoyl-L-alanine amidase n=1 Tax=Clostridium drakei TaxID=332101 RepID=A0A2U8DKM6_9CLOT|nr:N-acetylmuramoyl-L-alanine amidase [Clostridium drakei]AWI03011.1 N-acetylmuramoyl-L-alanine amidase [Clostridium drakei]